MGVLTDGYNSLSADINKVKGVTDETKEGVVQDSIGDELTLELSDDRLIELATRWEDRWMKAEGVKQLERKRKQNEKYWMGDHHTPSQQATGKRELVDNLVWEAVETALPYWTKQVAEPYVTSDDSPEGQALAKKITDRIVDLADVLRLRLKVRKSARHWALYYLGCIKVGWSAKENDITVEVKRPQKLILDPDAITDEGEYQGTYLGDLKEDTAEDLLNRFPDKQESILAELGVVVNEQGGIPQEKLGTKIRYAEFWTNDFVFWKMKQTILGKSKNPHWNYDQMSPEQQSVDEYGQPTVIPSQPVPGVNIFASRKMPYAFLSVYSLGKNPFDETSNVEQIIPLQDVVNKRQRQIDRNADSMNAGAVVSGEAFTKEQAKQVADALRKGLTVWVPRGNVNNVYKRDTGQAMPEFIYESLQDYRNEIRNSFGISGLSGQGLKNTETVRGKIMVRGTDVDRQSPIVDSIEQFYDYLYNWFAQLMVVYYDDPRAVNRTQGSTTIVNSEFTHPVVISVKEGSLIPKDPLTKRNEAMDLWNGGAMDPITLYERLDDPNPFETAYRLFLWKSNPMLLFQEMPEVQQMMQAQQQQGPPNPDQGQPNAPPNPKDASAPPQDIQQGGSNPVDQGPPPVELSQVPIK